MALIEKVEKIFYNKGGKPKDDGTVTQPNFALQGQGPDGPETIFVPIKEGKKLIADGYVGRGKRRDGGEYPKVVKQFGVEGDWYGIRVIGGGAPTRAEQPTAEGRAAEGRKAKGVLDRAVFVATYAQSIEDGRDLMAEFFDADRIHISDVVSVAATLFIERAKHGVWAPVGPKAASDKGGASPGGMPEGIFDQKSEKSSYEDFPDALDEEDDSLPF